MSAICGFYQTTSVFTPSDIITHMLGSLAHRGIDGQSSWSSAEIGLGHSLLQTTPESKFEKQPLVSDGLVLIADARIDNRDELLSQIDLRRTSDHPITDAEFILTSYRRWGSDCVNHFVGVWAFALWDEQEKRLFLARDHIGIKPLYYVWKPPHFAFATEIKALLLLPFVSHEPDEYRIADHLANHLNETELTFYRDVKRLPPAQCITIQQNKRRQWSFWSPYDVPDVRFTKPEDYIESFREIFGRAVKAQLRSAFSVGAMLSGGLDSSAVVGVARTQMQNDGILPLRTYSVIFPETEASDESQYINAVTSLEGITSHLIRGEKQSTLLNEDLAFQVLEEPHLIANSFMSWRIFEAAQHDNIRIVLDGVDGDTTLSHGVGYLAEMVRTGNWSEYESVLEKLQSNWDEHKPYSKRMFHNMVALPRLSEFLRTGRIDRLAYLLPRLHKATGISRRELLLRDTFLTALPHNWRWTLERLRQPNVHRRDYAIINESFYQRMLPHLRERSKNLLPIMQPRDSRNGHAVLIVNGAIPTVFEFIDRAAAHFRIEARHPFCDLRLIEYCIGIPGELKLVDGVSRWLLRQSLAGVLPDAVRWRYGKSNLTYSFNHSFLKHDFSAASQLNLDTSPLLPYVDPKHLRRLTESVAGGAGGTKPYRLWSVVILNQWLTALKMNE